MNEGDDVDDEVNQLGVDEHRCHETPPLAVRRARSEVAAPEEQRLRIIEAPAPNSMQIKIVTLKATSVGVTSAQRVLARRASRNGSHLPTAMNCGVLPVAEYGKRGSKESRPFLGRHGAEDNTEDQHESDGHAHVHR